jgi:hypothetical protein
LRQWEGQRDAAAFQGGLRMTRLVDLHLAQHRARAGVLQREFLEVLLQMSFHLVFGFHDKAQAGSVTRQCGNRTDQVTAGIPDRVEQAGAAVQLLQALGAPCQVVGFLRSGMQQVLANFGVAREGGLAVVKRLGADLARMIDAHQAGGMAAFDVVHGALGHARSWRRPLRVRVTGHRLQRALASRQQTVKCAEAANIRGHARLQEKVSSPHGRNGSMASSSNPQLRSRLLARRAMYPVRPVCMGAFQPADSSCYHCQLTGRRPACLRH